MAARDQFRKANQYASTGVATLLSVDHVMFWCLCELEGWPSLREEEGAEKLRWVDASVDRLRIWAKNAPDNFAHKLALVEAERARAVADRSLAGRHYQSALGRAASIDFLHDRALIEERAGDFYESVGERQLACQHLLNAQREYKTWGSVSIAKAMSARYVKLPLSDASAINRLVRGALPS